LEKVAAGRRRAGDGGAGEGVTAAAVFRRVSGGLVGALGGGDVDGGGGARLARWGEQGTAAAPGADR